MYYIASVSLGKDSYAMVNLIIDKGLPLDEVVFYDTGAEFPCIYRLWEVLKRRLEDNNIKYTTLHPSTPFFDKMFNVTVKNRCGDGTHLGYSWCGGRCRWGTTEKVKTIDKYCESKNAYVYVGIAADENRQKDKPYKLHPLKDLGYTEAMCLDYCRSIGAEWLEDGVDLYDILDRVSCWCCANKNTYELYQYWKNLPTWWGKLLELQRKNSRPFKQGLYGYNLFELEERFKSGYVPKKRNKYTPFQKFNSEVEGVSYVKEN